MREEATHRGRIRYFPRPFDGGKGSISKPMKGVPSTSRLKENWKPRCPYAPAFRIRPRGGPGISVPDGFVLFAKQVLSLAFWNGKLPALRSLVFAHYRFWNG